MILEEGGNRGVAGDNGEENEVVLLCGKRGGGLEKMRDGVGE